MTDMASERLDACEIAQRLARNELSSEHLVRSCLERIAAREPDIRAWAHVAATSALAAAREADTERLARGRSLGPLDGIPVGLKDVIGTSAMPTQYNSASYAGNRTGTDASLTGLLRSAGAIILGKTETVEFAAHGRNAMTRNPHDLSRTPGGSSSGSAAAVADFMVPIAFGTQTGGSVIRPASYCGVFGYKPTHGLVCTEGMKVFAPTLDTIGWFARSVRDIARVAQCLGVCEDREQDAAKRPRIGIYRTAYWEQAEPDAQRAFDLAARRLSACADMVEFAPGQEFEDLDALKLVIMQGEGWASFLDLYRRLGDATPPGIRKRMTPPDHRALRRAIDEAARLRPLFEERMGDLDVVVTPAAPGEATPGIASTGSPIFNSLWTLLHLPCLSMPVLSGGSGLPLGLQLVGRRYEDGDLLAVADHLLPAFAEK